MRDLILVVQLHGANVETIFAALFPLAAAAAPCKTGDKGDVCEDEEITITPVGWPQPRKSPCGVSRCIPSAALACVSWTRGGRGPLLMHPPYPHQHQHQHCMRVYYREEEKEII